MRPISITPDKNKSPPLIIPPPLVFEDFQISPKSLPDWNKSPPPLYLKILEFCRHPAWPGQTRPGPARPGQPGPTRPDPTRPDLTRPDLKEKGKGEGKERTGEEKEKKGKGKEKQRGRKGDPHGRVLFDAHLLILFCSVPFRSVTPCSVLFGSVLFCSVLKWEGG